MVRKYVLTSRTFSRLWKRGKGVACHHCGDNLQVGCTVISHESRVYTRIYHLSCYTRCQV
jgi:hypothetical protein